MPTDANIILQGKPVETVNPLDMAAKVMTLKNLGIQNQNAQLQNQDLQRQFDSKSAIRDAYKQNTTVGPDGTPQVNMQGFMNQAMQTDPQGAIQISQEMRKNQIAMQQAQLEKTEMQRKYGSDIMSEVAAAPPEGKQDAWTRMIAKGAAFGLPNNDHLPVQFPGDNYVNNILGHLDTFKDQLEQKNKQIDQGIAQDKLGVEKQDLAMKRQQFGYTKNFDAVKQAQNSIDASRQSADAVQSLKDRQAADKVNELVDKAPGGDPNKLNNSQLKLVATEVAKMAGGGAPTEGELESLTPENIAQKYGSVLQKLTNKSEPANAGEFVKQFQDYANGISKIGTDRLSQRANRVVDELKPYMADKDYSTFKDRIQKEFPQRESKSSSSVMSFDEWRAKQAGK